MNLFAAGCNFRTAPVSLREQLAFDDSALAQARQTLAAQYGAEAVLLATCNRVELYTAPAMGVAFTPGEAAAFFAKAKGLSTADVAAVLYHHDGPQAVKHLCRVAASLDSLVVGEGQIAGQVKKAYEAAKGQGTTGPLLNALFPFALRIAKKVRTDTGISKGHVSVPSVAVDYVKQVFDHFTDKTILVIGAGKMGRLTLKHLAELKPGRILVTNRSPAKAEETAALCGGKAIPWEQLHTALAQADIALSTTGAPEPIVTASTFATQVNPHRTSGPLLVLDIAVPRDFDPAIHDGDRAIIVNVDDLTRVREQALAVRKKHIVPAEAMVEAAVNTFTTDWNRRRSGPVIKQLTAEFDRVREGVTAPLLAKFNGKLSPEEKQQLEYAFRLFQNQLLHGPIAALQDANKEGSSGSLLDAMKKIFRLNSGE